MVKLVKLQCPSCKGILKRRGITTYKCSNCLMKYKLNVDSIIPVDRDVYIGNRNSNTNAAKGKNTSQSIRDYISREQKKSSITIIISVTVFLILMVGMIIASIALIDRDNGNSSNNGSDNNTFPTTATTKNQNVDYTVHSDYFKRFLSVVFGKDSSQVTKEELAEITSIDLKNSTTHLSYRRNDGELQYVDMPSSLTVNYSDLKAFTGLKSLSAKGSSKLLEVLPFLENLEELTCNKSPKELLKYIKYPEKLKSLECYVDDSELGEIERFCNLEKLNIEIYISSIRSKEKPDLSGIGSLTKLEDLKISAKEYTVFPFISQLPNLKSINLHCKNLRDISFLIHTQKLESLTLVDTDIISLDALQYVPNLKVLRLNDCNEVKDFSIVSSLTGLEELMLSYAYKQQLPEDFDRLKNVTRLTLDGFNDISFLSQFSNVKKLELYGCNFSNLPNIACMKNLEELKIGAGTNLSGLEFLKEFPKLERVKFYSTRLATDTEQLFMLPNIKELDLANTEIYIDLNGIEKNESLEKINFDNIRLYGFNDEKYAANKKYIYDNWQELDMNTYFDFVQNFPNLKYLSVEGHKLQSIAFLENMQKLEYLNITNNYVVDIKPLNKLKSLKKVLCGENPVDPKLKLEDRIEVDFDSKSTYYNSFSNYEF